MATLCFTGTDIRSSTNRYAVCRKGDRHSPVGSDPSDGRSVYGCHSRDPLELSYRYTVGCSMRIFRRVTTNLLFNEDSPPTASAVAPILKPPSCRALSQRDQSRW